MQLFEGDLLHVYNRGNNKQAIFFEEDNYRFFLDKVNKHVAGVADILSYCLMPNHFHFLLHVNEHSCNPKQIGSLTSTALQNGFRILQSSYASAINKQFNRTGSLFQQNTKFKKLNDTGFELSFLNNYAETCFHYVHQNPVKADLVNRLEDWHYSSFREYLYPNDNGLCNRELAVALLDIDMLKFRESSYAVIKDELLEKLY